MLKTHAQFTQSSILITKVTGVEDDISSSQSLPETKLKVFLCFQFGVGTSSYHTQNREALSTKPWNRQMRGRPARRRQSSGNCMLRTRGALSYWVLL